MSCSCSACSHFRNLCSSNKHHTLSAAGQQQVEDLWPKARHTSAKTLCISQDAEHVPASGTSSLSCCKLAGLQHLLSILEGWLGSDSPRLGSSEGPARSRKLNCMPELVMVCLQRFQASSLCSESPFIHDTCVDRRCSPLTSTTVHGDIL